MLLIGLKQSSIRVILQNVAGTSADVFLNCSFDYIGFILPPSHQNNSLGLQNGETP
jgi:hypothetical protein